MLSVVVDSRAQKSMLAAIIGGEGPSDPSALERNILADFIARMLEGKGFEEVSKSAGDPLCAGDGTQCLIDLGLRRGHSATISAYCAARENAPSQRSTPQSAAHMLSIPLTLRVELTSVAMPLGLVGRLRRGSLLPIAPSGDVVVKLFSNARCVARGVLGSVGARRCMKVNALTGGAP